MAEQGDDTAFEREKGRIAAYILLKRKRRGAPLPAAVHSVLPPALPQIDDILTLTRRAQNGRRVGVSHHG